MFQLTSNERKVLILAGVIVIAGLSIRLFNVSTIPVVRPRQVSQAIAQAVINVNTASQDELTSLPGIGPVLAQRIIEYRAGASFRGPEDLKKVKGIKDRQLVKLKGKIKFE